MPWWCPAAGLRASATISAAHAAAASAATGHSGCQATSRASRPGARTSADVSATGADPEADPADPELACGLLLLRLEPRRRLGDQRLEPQAQRALVRQLTGQPGQQLGDIERVAEAGGGVVDRVQVTHAVDAEQRHVADVVPAARCVQVDAVGQARVALD